MSTTAHKLLFVCTGNTCRSQIAHAMSCRWAQSMALDMAIKSRGIRAKEGAPTNADAILVLTAKGIQWQGTSQQLQLADLAWADDVWVMTQEQLHFAEQLATKLDAARSPRIELQAFKVELLDPLDCGLEAYEQLLQALTILLPRRLEAIL